MKLHLILLVSLVYLSVASMAYPSNSEVDIDLNLDFGEGIVLSKSRTCAKKGQICKPWLSAPCCKGRCLQVGKGGQKGPNGPKWGVTYYVCSR